MGPDFPPDVAIFIDIPLGTQPVFTAVQDAPHVLHAASRIGNLMGAAQPVFRFGHFFRP